MKKIILLLAFMALTSLAQGQTNIMLVDTATPHTNVTTSSAFLFIPGVCTNAPYTASNNAAITLGDPLVTAFVAVNNDVLYLNGLATNGAVRAYAPTNSTDGTLGSSTGMLRLGTNSSAAGSYYLYLMVSSNQWVRFTGTNW